MLSNRGYDIAKLFKDAPIVMSENPTRDHLNYEIALDFAKKYDKGLHIYRSQDSVKRQALTGIKQTAYMANRSEYLW